MQVSTSDTIQSKVYASFSEYNSHIAITYGARDYTYQDLDIASNQLSAWLLENNLGRKHVAICLQDRWQLISWMIAILKARSVFIPLDPHHPKERIEQLLAISEAELLITDHTRAEELTASNVRVLVHEAVESVTVQGHATNASIPTGDDEVYIYFTSGSTGTPKAIVGKNSSLAHFVNWEIETFGLTQESKVSQFISPGFDAFLRDVFPALSVGGRICIPDFEISDRVQLLNWISDQKISLIHCVPSFFKLLLHDQLSTRSLASLRHILLSGEPISIQDLKTWYDRVGHEVQLVNLYGATETTMIKTYYLIQPTDIERSAIPIGKPIAGSQVFLLDDSLRPIGKHSVGEIYIRTNYGTHGYYKNEQLNAERFIKNPYGTEASDVLYKTGDLGRFDASGNLEFLGRKDRQIKIRGVRIEPGEIEQHLLQHHRIAEAIIAPVQVADDMLLSAYVIAKGELTETEVKAYLLARLPTYLVPVSIVFMSSFPLLSNGKIDINSLTSNTLSKTSEYIAPRNEVEQELLKIIAESLGKDVNEVGINDNFFELGANSISLVAIQRKINVKFNANVSLVSLHQWPNVAAYTQYLTNQDQLETIETALNADVDLSEALDDMIDLMDE